MDKVQAEDPKVEDTEKALVKQYAERIKGARKREEKRFARFQAHRKYYRGEVHKDQATGLVRTNIIFSTIATLYPAIYAKNPDISITPAEKVGDDDYDVVKKYAKTASSVLDNLMIRGGSLKRRAKAWVRSAMLCQVGWLKVTYQKDIREDPLIKNRMDDIQDNIEKLKAAQRHVADGECGDPDLELAQLQQQIAALQPNLEVVVSSGLVIDKVQTEDLLILDPTIKDFDEYPNSSAIAQQVWMTADQFETNFGRKATAKAQKWYGNAAPTGPTTEGKASGADGEDCFHCVCEIWDKSSNTIYTWCDGEEGWAREPYQPERVGKRWYPFFGLCFNPVDGEFYGVSDVELLLGLQEEYNTTRTNFAEHRKYSIPIRVVRAGGSLTPEDLDNLKKAKHGDTVVVGGDSSVPLSNDTTMLVGAPIDPGLYDVTQIRADIELVSGSTDANRGNVLRAKTATEAEIMQQGLAGRTAERQDTISDEIQEMAEYCLQLCIKELTPQEVQKLAGADAVWPAAPTDDALDTLSLEIRAGSTGKPNQNAERDQWIQLMPLLQDAMTKVMELRQAGQNDMADAVVELTRESLHRFDERIDIDALLPRKKEGAMDPAAIMAENEQLKQVVPLLQQQLQQLSGVVEGKQVEAQQKVQQDQVAAQEKVEMEAIKAQQAAQELQIKEEAKYRFEAEQRELDRQNAQAIAQINADAKVAGDALAEALTSNKQLQARLDALEKAVGSIPPAEEPIDVNALKLEVRDMIDQHMPKPGDGGSSSEPAEPAQPMNLTITVPVTVGGQTTTKTGTAVKKGDKWVFEATETPGKEVKDE